MRTTSLVFCSLALSSLLGCGGTGSTAGSGGGASSSSGAGGGASSSASSASSSASTSGSASTSSSGASSSSSGGNAACGTIDLSEDNGGLKQYSSICQNSWGSGQSMKAIGYLSAGPGLSGMRIVIEGCQSAAAMSPGIKLTAEDAMAPGDYTIGLTTYTDMAGKTWGVQGDPFDVTVTKMDMVGGAIDGTFKVTVTQGGASSHVVAGSFHVCRVSDELLP